MYKKIAMMFLMIAMVFTFSACKTKGFSKDECQNGGEVRSYQELDIFLDAGETYKIDVMKVYSKSNVYVTDYELTSLNEDVAKVNGSTVTAITNGIAAIHAKLYDTKNGYFYETSLAFVYVIDEENMTPITTAQELSDMRNNLSGNYILKADIDLANWGEWEPIARIYTVPVIGYDFSGLFINRGGYKIKNLKILENNGSSNIRSTGGLFGDLRGYVDGIILEDVKMSNNELAGGIAVISQGIIANCRVSGEITAQSVAGGICGNTIVNIYSNSVGRIINCEFSGEVKTLGLGANPMVGGIVGSYNRRIKTTGGVINCHLYGKVTRESIYVPAGGIIGSAFLAMSLVTGNEIDIPTVNCTFGDEFSAIGDIHLIEFY